MNFFTLRISSNLGSKLYESDLDPLAFEGFAKRFASELVHYKVFNAGERFVMRIVPRWGGTPCYDKPELPDARTLPPLKNAFTDFVWEEPVSSEPLRHLTLRWHSADRNLVYQQDLSVAAMFQSFVNLAVSHLLEQGKLAEGENFKYEIFARDQGLPTIDQELMSPMAATTTVSPSPAPIQPLSERPKRDFQIAITGKTALVVPKPKSPSSYDGVEAVGPLKAGELRVYLHRNAWLSLRSPAKISLEKQVEVAGILVGGVFTDDSGETFVEVAEAIPAPEAQGDFYKVKIDSEVWRGLIEKVNLQYPDSGKVLVGWYHTHLISKLNMAPSAAASGGMQASRQTFLSSDDVFIHDNFFLQPWHVALVLDLSRKQDVFFHREGRQLVECSGFFLFGTNAAACHAQ